MKPITALLLSASCLLSGVIAAGAIAAEASHQKSDDSVRLTESDKYELTVPARRLVLKFPKGTFVPSKTGLGGAAANPGYFYFVDDRAGFVVTGWFEPAEEYRGNTRNWEERNRGNKDAGLPEPENVSFGRIGMWDVVRYSLRPKGAPPNAGYPQMLANLVQADTWIELHLSLSARGADGGDRLGAFLRQVEVVVTP